MDTEKISYIPNQGDLLWIKTDAKWESGIYIGYDVTKSKYVARSVNESNTYLIIGDEVLSSDANPENPKEPKTAEEKALLLFGSSEIGIAGDKRRTWLDGAKWQHEQFSDDIIKFVDWIFDSGYKKFLNEWVINYSNWTDAKTTYELYEEFKKCVR
jgi:hypothetical protein